MKNFILIGMLLMCLLGYAQTSPDQTVSGLSPDDVLENVYDQYGNAYKLSDIIVGKGVRDSNGQVLRATNPNPLTCGYFNLYLEDGCGLSVTDTDYMNRRNVVCQVFSDLSAFINSPLTANGNRVNIWVRNINNIITPPSTPNGILGLASAFYNMPLNTTAGFGGIIDNEVYKTIQSGINSYTNVVSPLINNGIDSDISGLFYHGMMSFNFNTNNTPSITWHTSLTTPAPNNKYDLYTVILHEITHSLGFASLINENGLSKFGAGLNYYTRYDRFLKNSSNTQFLITNAGACSPMYNYIFNTTLSPTILRPGCTLVPPTSSGSADQTVCGTAIRYVGTSNVPVYTPICFEPASSLSHFEDQCYPPNVNNAYFTMSNAAGNISPNNMKRYLKAEERNVLKDLGYSVNTTFGNASNINLNYNNYGGTLTSVVIPVGIHDGINPNGTYKYIGLATVGNPIVINSSTNTLIRILSNDVNATGFECLQDVFSPSSFSFTSGTATTNVTFSTAVPGLHLLRYVPTNGTQRGNITYIYVYVTTSTNCAVPTSCNLVANGNFEEFSTLPNNLSQLTRACGWDNSNTATPDYFRTNALNLSARVPCNLFGTQTDKLNLNGYAGMWLVKILSTVGDLYYESIKTKLVTPLTPKTNYQLSFDVSLAEGASVNAYRFQAYLSTTEIVSAGHGEIPIANPNMLFTNNVQSTNYSGWTRISFNFQTNGTAGEQYLYLGGLSAATYSTVTPAPADPSCAYSNLNTLASINQGRAYYYLDNVSLIPSNGAEIIIPSVCLGANLSSLESYLSGIPAGGTFTGTGVSGSAGSHSFNSTIAGLGTHPISYNYVNGSGCNVTIYTSVLVTKCSTNCIGDLTFTTTEPSSTGTTYQAVNTITTMTDYLINPGTTITMKAGTSVISRPNSHVKSGSNFLAKIEDCPTSKGKNSMVSIEEGIKLYPNPTKETITISTEINNLKNIRVYSLDGKLVFNQDIEKTTTFQLNVTHYQNGVYLAIIETENGTIYREKIMKN